MQSSEVNLKVSGIYSISLFHLLWVFFFFFNVKPALYMFLLMASEECFWLAMTGRSNGLICPQKSVDILILNFFSFWMRNYIMYVLLDYMENVYTFGKRENAVCCHYLYFYLSNWSWGKQTISLTKRDLRVVWRAAICIHFQKETWFIFSHFSNACYAPNSVCSFHCQTLSFAD